MTIPKFLHGVHDTDGVRLMDGYPGWVVITEAIGHDPNNHNGRDFSQWSRNGLGVVVRLNNAHDGVNGTIPEARYYRDFATRCANYVAASVGIDVVIIGNEPNHSNEWPRGVKIDSADYARCYGECRMAIRGMRTDLPVLVAAIAPWNNESGDWLVYFKRVINQLWQGGDGFALHAYTHGADPKLIFSDEMQHGWYWHFRVYRQQMVAIREIVKGAVANMLFLITETNQGDNPWLDADSGWVQNAYQEIAAWNQIQPLMPIRGLCLYRSNRDDRWSFADKEGVKKDFRKAVERGHESPPLGKADTMPEQEFIPFVPNESTPTQPAPDLPPREWDERLTARGVTVKTPQIEPGQRYWQVAKARWYDEQESQGRHHIYVEAPDDTPFRVVWPSGGADGWANGRSGFDAGNFPMSKSLNEFSVFIDDGKPSEVLQGIGMGANGNSGIHTSTGVTFQLTAMPQAQPQPPTEQPQPASAIGYVTAPLGLRLRDMPSTLGNQLALVPYGEQVRIVAVANQEGWVRARYGDKEGWMASQYISLQPPEKQPTEPTPEPLTPGNERDNWTRCIAFVRKWEGGWADDPNDVGGATNKGITLATFTRWRAIQGQPAPTKAELFAISDAEVNQIYFEWYWKASKSDTLPWPLCLAVFDLAVNGGVGRSDQALKEAGHDFLKFMAWRIDWYTRISNFEYFGKAWVRRCADLLREVAK